MSETKADPARKPKQYGLTVFNYALEFAHETGAWPIELTVKVRGRRVKQEVVRKRRTIATLIQLAVPGIEAEAVVATGEAYCSPNDTYDREVGRQLALYDLLPGLPKKAGGQRIRLGRALIGAYLQRPGALPWALDKEGHLKPWILLEARTGLWHMLK